MTGRGPALIVAILAIATLTACVNTSPPAALPTSSASLSPSAPFASPTPSATPTSAPSPSVPPPPPSNPPPSDPPPHRVAGVSATTGGGSGEVLLRWIQNSEQDVVSYIVLRALSPGGSLTRIGAVTRQEVTQFEYVPFVDSDATVGYYRVRAVDSAGQAGPESAEVCGSSVGHSC